jgi:hypothetical protein
VSSEKRESAAQFGTAKTNKEVVPLTSIHGAGRNEQASRDVEPRPDAVGHIESGLVVERYTVAKDAALAVAVALGPDAESRSELVLAAFVALMDSVGDVPVLLRALRASQLRAANLAAAGKATLAAFRDGEADPLYYLRDQLDHDVDESGVAP